MPVLSPASQYLQAQLQVAFETLFCFLIFRAVIGVEALRAMLPAQLFSATEPLETTISVSEQQKREQRQVEGLRSGHRFR